MGRLLQNYNTHIELNNHLICVVCQRAEQCEDGNKKETRNISPFFVLRSITQNVSNQIYVMQSKERVKGESRVAE